MMGRITRRNSEFEARIEHLQRTLKPFIQYPHGPIHPAFPPNLMAWHLLTEDELDSMAHFYHQSTPGPYTRCYPVTMNWDKDFLARTPTDAQPGSLDPTKDGSEIDGDGPWLTDLIASVGRRASSSPDCGRRLSKQDRVRIKRRKFGRFIGLRGMETPREEVFARVQASWDRAIERSRAEMRQNEEAMLGRRKVG